MALNAVEFFPLDFFAVPVSVFPAVNGHAPFPVVGAVAFSAEFRRFIARNLATVMVNENVAVLRVMAIQAQKIQTVAKGDVRMFPLQGLFTQVTLKAVVTHGTLVFVAVTVQA